MCGQNSGRERPPALCWLAPDDVTYFELIDCGVALRRGDFGACNEATRAWLVEIYIGRVRRPLTAAFDHARRTVWPQQETTVRKRDPAPKWQQQLEAIDQLPKSQTKFLAQMLDALIAQATTKASSEGREVLQ